MWRCLFVHRVDDPEALAQIETASTALNAVLRRYSAESDFVFLAMPRPEMAATEPARWAEATKALTEGLPPTGLAVAGERGNLFYTAEL